MRNFSLLLVCIWTLTSVFSSSCQDCVAQNQYTEICKRQYELANPDSPEALKAALKLTDSLYYYDLKAALSHVNETLELAKKLDDQQAVAVCEIDCALITGWHVGQAAAQPHFDLAMELFDETASPEYRVHFYSSAILFEIFRNTGQAKLSEYFRLNELAAKQCQDPYLEIHQHMLSAFNRVVLGHCSPDCPEIMKSRERILDLNEQLNLDDARAILKMFDAFQNEPASKEYFVNVKEALEAARRSGNRLYQAFALAALVSEPANEKDWEKVYGLLEQALKLAEAHHSPPLIFDFLANMAGAKKSNGDLAEAKSLIDRALDMKFLNSRSTSDRHSLYKLAFEVHCLEDDVEGIKKYAKLMSAPEHMLAVVETKQHNQQLRSEIAKLEQDKLATTQYFQDSRNDFQAAQERSARTIKTLSIGVLILSMFGLITALYINRNRLLNVRQRLSEEQETSRLGNQIREGLESKLNRLRRMESLGLLAGGVAHDFNNLLVGVIGNAEILKMKPHQNESFVNERIDRIIDSAEKAADLSRQMLAYAGKQQIQRQAVDLNNLVTEMDSVLRSSLRPDTVLTTELSRVPLVCEIDETQIDQVLLNLVSNAISACDQGGRIAIRTGQEDIEEIDQHLHGTRTVGGLFNYLEVEDTGNGISESELERIFEPFFTDKSRGRGLGLAVVYGMVNGHEGLIRTRSEVGKGTMFRILLPAALAPVADSQTSQLFYRSKNDEQEKVDRPTVLIVDDEHSVLDLTQQFLSLKGWPVLTASNGRDALAQIEEHKDQIGFILLDVVMDEMGAEEVMQELDDRQIQLPIILMSGYSHTQLDELKADSQVVAVLEKPFRLKSLLEAMAVASNADANDCSENAVSLG